MSESVFHQTGRSHSFAISNAVHGCWSRRGRGLSISSTGGRYENREATKTKAGVAINLNEGAKLYARQINYGQSEIWLEADGKVLSAGV
jgi:hypothetical protein